MISHEQANGTAAYRIVLLYDRLLKKGSSRPSCTYGDGELTVRLSGERVRDWIQSETRAWVEI